MSSLNVLVYDDDNNVAERLARSIHEAFNGEAFVQPKGKEDFSDLLHLLHERRTEPSSEEIGGDRAESHEADEADVIVVDYDLRQYSSSATGSRMAYLLRCFSKCGFIVIVNQYGTNTFDLGLSPGFSSGFNNIHFDFADLHIGDAHIGNPGLWRADFEGYRPWYWPIIPDARTNFEKCVNDVQEHLDESIIDFLGLNGVTDWIPGRARSFLSSGHDIREVTFRSFGESTHSGVGRKDELTHEQFPRVVAARIITFLNSVLLPEQSVLVDAPHLASRFPSLIREKHTDMNDWNMLCDLSLPDEDELLSEDFRKHKFQRSHWLWRPAWYWPKINRDEDIEEVKNPWSVHEVDWVFCENISQYVPKTFAQDFRALVSPAIHQAIRTQRCDRRRKALCEAVGRSRSLRPIHCRLRASSGIQFVGITMSIKPATKDVRSAVSDILSRFMVKYEWTHGRLSVLRNKIYCKYYRLGNVDDGGLDSMLLKYEDVTMRDQSLYLYLEPTKDKKILPLVTMQSSHKWVHFRIYTLLTTLDDNMDIQSVAIRFETDEGSSDSAVSVGSHDFCHAQFCEAIGSTAQATTPEWIPTSQPSFPLDADDQVSLVLCMLTSLYGGAHVLSKFSATGDNNLREYLAKVRALSTP